MERLEQLKHLMKYCTDAMQIYVQCSVFQAFKALSLRSRSLFLQLRVQIAIDDGAIVVVVAIKGP